MGARYTSTLVHDVIVAPFDVRPALGPAVGIALSTPLHPGWAAQATVDFSTSDLQRHDAGGGTASLGRVSTVSFAVGLKRRVHAGVVAGATVGALKYLPGEDAGIFRQGGGSLAATGSLSVARTLPVARGRLAIEARYDAHGFTTPALRAEGFNTARVVHRVAVSLRAGWGIVP